MDLEDQNSCLEDRILQLKTTSSLKQEQTLSSTLSKSKNRTLKIPDTLLYCEIDSYITIEDWT